MSKNVAATEDWARKFFFEDPSASVDTAAREMVRHCTASLHKDALSRIRMEVRQKIEHGGSNGNHQGYSGKPLPAAKGPVIRKHGAPPVRKAKEPFNPPKIRLPQNDPEAGMTVEEAARAEAAQTPQAEAPRTEAPSSSNPLVAKLEQSNNAQLLWVFTALKAVYGGLVFTPSSAGDILGAHGELMQRDIADLAEKYQLVEVAKRLPRGVVWRLNPTVLTDADRAVTEPNTEAARKAIELRKSFEEQKISWMYDFCEKNPTLSPGKVQEFVIQAWGSGIYVPKISEALKLARKLAGLPEVEPVTAARKNRLAAVSKKKGAAEEIRTGAEVLHLQKERREREAASHLAKLMNAAKELARQMKLTSTREVVITIDAEGGIDFRYKRVEVTTSGGKLDID